MMVAFLLAAARVLSTLLVVGILWQALFLWLGVRLTRVEKLSYP
jgi:hypothetical protein